MPAARSTVVISSNEHLHGMARKGPGEKEAGHGRQGKASEPARWFLRGMSSRGGSHPALTLSSLAGLTFVAGDHL